MDGLVDNTLMKRFARLSLCLALLSVGAATPAQSPDDLIAQVKALKQDEVAWRKIGWRTCLLEGLAESRAQKKPIVLWIFIDRPIDDERC